MNVSRENVSAFLDDNAPQYVKVVPIRARRMSGPFTVETSEGTLSCADGYLCIDSRGYPYPVAADEFETIYRPAPAEIGVGATSKETAR